MGIVKNGIDCMPNRFFSVHSQSNMTKSASHNLNALEVMPSGGRLEIRCYEEKEFINIVFVYTGISMNEDTQKNIFAPFFSTNDEWGTGLGLAISYRIVADHNGEIGVSSSVDEGSCFTVRLPINVESHNNLEEHDGATDIDS